MLLEFFTEIWNIFLELSPSLLLGLFIAGLMHVYLPAGFIHRGLSKPNLSSVMKASFWGVPLPLCSCGVIPTALGLRRDGASKGATTAFMISTPQTGVDSLMVSAAFLGWPFALFKLLAAFIAGFVGGSAVNQLTEDEPHSSGNVAEDEKVERSFFQVIHYAIFDLLAAIDLWVLAGIAIAALITLLLPADYFSSQGWAQGLTGMLVVLAISLPLYVCTTGSVPIAASLIAAGMPVGSALVFLMAGPATNVATIGAVYRALGGRILAIYLTTVIVVSLVLGLFFESLVSITDVVVLQQHHHQTDWLGILSAIVLIGLLALLSGRRILTKFSTGEIDMSADLTLNVEGMSCGHCVAAVKKVLEAEANIESANPDLSSNTVQIVGDSLDATALIKLIDDAGYKASE